jgi:hypothetical protein
MEQADLKRSFAITLFCALLWLSSCSPKAEPISSFEGKLLLHRVSGENEGGETRRVIYELAPGSTAPQERLVLPVGPDVPMGDVSVSADQTLAFFPPQTLLELDTGEMRDIPLPQDIREGYPVSNAAFSPDGRFLAYIARVGTEKATRKALCLVDLTADRLTEIHSQPCATYGVGSASITEACGDISHPYWLDAKEIALFHYSGPLPERINLGADELNSNTVTVMTVAGDTLRTFNTSLQTCSLWRSEAVLTERGATILVEDPSNRNPCFPPAWLAAADLRQGVFETHPIGPGPFYPSPDGRTLLVGGDPRQPLNTWQWRLVDVQSGKTTRLATHYELHYLARCVWSPDQSQVACLAREPKRGDMVLLIVPLSSQASSMTVLRWDGEEGESWDLLAWIPTPARTGPPAPVKTSSPAPVPSPTSLPVAVVLYRSVNVRAGPGTDRPIVGGLVEGNQLAVLGRNAEGTWLRIQTQEGLSGWVSAELVRCDAAQEVPVVTPSP